MNTEQLQQKPIVGIVDNKKIWQDVLQKALSPNHGVVIFSSIRQTESYLDSGQQPTPHVLLVGMRRTNILSTVTFAKKLAEKKSAAPVVVYTSLEDPAIREKVSEEGHVQAYLTVPFSLEDLTTTVATALQQIHE